jgi:hypothetical protein
MKDSRVYLIHIREKLDPRQLLRMLLANGGFDPSTLI